MAIDDELRQRLRVYQKNEITEHQVYASLGSTFGPEKRAVLKTDTQDPEAKAQGSCLISAGLADDANAVRPCFR